jgi:hypothetical protein
VSEDFTAKTFVAKVKGPGGFEVHIRGTTVRVSNGFLITWRKQNGS